MKTEELTALGLTDEQASKVFEMHGKELTKVQNSVTSLTAERDTLKTQLTDANTKLNGYDPEWSTKAATAQQQADEKIAALQYEFAAKAFAESKKFTSNGAKKDFLSALIAKKLPLQDGKFLGADDFEKTYRESDPGAFAGEKPAPEFTDPMGEKGAPEVTKEAFAKMSYMEKYKLKTEKPEIYKRLSEAK